MWSLLERVARHWFLFFIVFGGFCLTITGWVARDFGLPYLLRDSQSLVDNSTYDFIAFFVSGPTFLTQLTATFMIGSIWAFAALLDLNPEHARNYKNITKHFKFLAPRVAVFSLIPLFAAYLSINERTPLLDNYEILRAILGTVSGYVLLAIFVVITHLLTKILKISMLKTTILISIVSLTFLAVFPKLLPVVAIGWILGCIILIYVIILLIPEYIRPIVFIVLVAYVSFSNGIPFKYSFDGIQKRDKSSYYEEKNLVNYFDSIQSNRPIRGLVDPILSLENWKSRTQQEKPKLVIVTTSGGAYRAAFWTAIVLDKLRKESKSNGQLRNLTDHVKLVTGASGGMVGAAYFIANRTPNGDRDQSILKTLENDIGGIEKRNNNKKISQHINDVFAPIPRDSLSPIVRQLVQKDFSHIFLPFQQTSDRGRELENQWKTLDVSFASLSKGERQGWRPSIILSPMLVETGQPMWISNLSLNTIRRDKAYYRSFRAKSPKQEKADVQQSAVEFFRLFPGSQKTFHLKTAVRMSASFAYISPAVEIPTKPAMRVADAGYYDNYGVNVSLAYLKNEKVIKWITQNTSGVILVQIRAFPTLNDVGQDQDKASRRQMIIRAIKPKALKERTQQARKSYCTTFMRSNQKIEEDDNSILNFSRAFSWLTSPFEARRASLETAMLVRNDQELKLLQEYYQEKTTQPNFFQTTVFENRNLTSLNWNMPENELQCLKDQFDAEHNQQALRELIEFWN